MIWQGVKDLASRRYTCGHCGSDIASHKGYVAQMVQGTPEAMLYICHHCSKPTFIEFRARGTSQIPGPPYGQVVQDVTDTDVVGVYDEARKAASAGAYTASVLACRKLLMHLAVGRGAKPGASFVDAAGTRGFESRPRASDLGRIASEGELRLGV